METQNLKFIYEQVMSMKLKDLNEAIDNATSEEEKDFYLELYNYKLASKQQKIINQKEFTI